MGHVISVVGIRAVPNKISAMTKMPVPCTKAELQQFGEICNYLSAYDPNLSVVIKPRRMLTQDGSDFIWSTTQQEEEYNKAMLFYRNTPPTGHTYSPA